jgi:hypothetical protein
MGVVGTAHHGERRFTMNLLLLLLSLTLGFENPETEDPTSDAGPEWDPAG